MGYGEYWCIDDWSNSHKFLENCQHCEYQFVKDGFHTICTKCRKIRRTYGKNSGWIKINKNAVCPLCKIEVQLVIVRWMRDYERCPICMVAIPLPKYILKFLSNPLKQKIKKLCKFQTKIMEAT